MSKNTVARFESGENVIHSTVTKRQTAFEAAGMEFSGKIEVLYRGGEANGGGAWPCIDLEK